MLDYHLKPDKQQFLNTNNSNHIYIMANKQNLKTMKIISIAYKTKAESDFDKSLIYVFIEPLSAGNHIVEAELLISTNDLSYYDDSLICDSYPKAHRKAFLSQMSEKDYNFLYGSK